MFFRLKHTFLFATAAAVVFLAGWACHKYSNSAGVSEKEVVAVVNGHDITFKDWMRQMDILRVFATPIDPEDRNQVKAVLESLIDQQVVLDAAQKAHYSDSAFDEGLKKRLLEADLKIKEIKDKLEKDMQTLQRIQNDYQDPYKKMLLARQFASNQMDKVVVTDKDLKDWYNQYEAQATQMGQKLLPFDKVKKRIKPDVQAEKFVKDMEAASKIDRKQKIIDKYLDNLSISQKLLGGGDKGLPETSIDEKTSGLGKK
jgi:hypothetical protein